LRKGDGIWRSTGRAGAVVREWGGDPRKSNTTCVTTEEKTMKGLPLRMCFFCYIFNHY